MNGIWRKNLKISNNLASRQEEVIALDEEAANIFGMNFTTKEALDRFQNILERLLDIQKTNKENIEYNQNFDAKIIKKEILAEFEYDCKGSSPYIVILELADNLNSDQAILEAANMYRADFNLQENGYLDIVANEVIFCWLMRCQAQFLQLRPLLGQWHILKDFCSVLIVLFSSYGLLNLARKLDVQFLDKFKAAYPRLNEILQYVGAFRIPKNNNNKNEDQKPVCFGFDEALETFNIHFVKQNITGNVIDKAKLKTNPLSHEIFKDLELPELHKEGRCALEIQRTRHKDYAEKKRTEREIPTHVYDEILQQLGTEWDKKRVYNW
ncbi:hypothetical protein C1646_775342 [Rhizophagus diaphanus]|nr:hypothetical protein C1646_775342 [Rhizophagus diaphanus] [Rhizophagus sp. MUCL 43196]